MDVNALQLGFFETFLGEGNTSVRGSSSIAKSGEVYRRGILNGSTIDANGVLHLQNCDLGGASLLETNANVMFSGRMGAWTNSTVNVVSFVADVVTFGSNTTFLKDINVQGSVGLTFSGTLSNVDARIERVDVGQVKFIADAGGLMAFGNPDDAFSRLILMNDAGGALFTDGSGNAVNQASLSYVDPSTLGIGLAGYSGANGALHLHELAFTNTSSGVQATLRNIGANSVTFIAGAGGGIFLSTDGENVPRLVLGNDGGGVFFGNGSVTALTDTSISRIAQGVLGVGKTGFGTADGQLRANLANVAFLVTSNNATIGANLAVTGVSTLSGIVATLTGTNATPVISATVDTSDAAHPALLLKNNTNFAHGNCLARMELLNASDGADVLQLATAGTGPFINADGKFVLNNAGFVTTYGERDTVGVGQPYLCAELVTNVHANTAIASTALIDPDAGLYRVSGALEITRAGTTSSQLGNVTLTFSSANGSAISATLGCMVNAGTVAANSVANTVGTHLSIIPFMFETDGGATINVAVAYVSVGGTKMNYHAHIMLERLS